MKHSSESRPSRKKNSVIHGIFLFLPYVLFGAAVMVLSVFVFKTVVSDSVYFKLAVTQAQVQEEPTEPAPKEEEPTEFPVIYYNDQWATVDVEGWTENTEIPVRFTGDNELLKQGATTPCYSSFCGQGGAVILSAHVTRHFSELEDTEPGAVVTVTTTYGVYRYKVVKKDIFDADDDPLSHIIPEGDKETLTMYTCYPRDNHHQKRTHRCALICEKIEGKDWYE